MSVREIVFSAAALLLAIAPAWGQSLAVESFTEIVTDMDARVNYPVKDQNNKTCAIIKVENPNTGFDFSVGTLGVQKVEQHTGEIWVYVPAGVKKITISHQQLGILRDYPLPVTVREATVYVLKLVSGTVETTIRQPVVKTGYLIINSEPQGADVFVNDEWAGTTPFQQKYKYGEHITWRLSKTKYHPEVGVADISKSKTEISLNLRPAFGSISLTSNPDGAQVFVDGEEKPRGETPITIDGLPSGSHEVVLRKDMYSPARMTLEVMDGQCTRIPMTLQPNFAEITITATAGAWIKINNKIMGAGSWTGNLVEGIYDIEASQEGYRTAVEQIEVFKGVKRTVNLKLTPIYGSVSIESTPMGAEIFIDGESVGTTPDVISDLLASRHTLKLSLDGYIDYTGTFDVEQDKETTVAVELKEKRSGNILYDDSKPATDTRPTAQQPGTTTTKKPVSSELPTGSSGSRTRKSGNDPWWRVGASVTAGYDMMGDSRGFGADMGASIRFGRFSDIMTGTIGANFTTLGLGEGGRYNDFTVPITVEYNYLRLLSFSAFAGVGIRLWVHDIKRPSYILQTGIQGKHWSFKASMDMFKYTEVEVYDYDIYSEKSSWGWYVGLGVAYYF